MRSCCLRNDSPSYWLLLNVGRIAFDSRRRHIWCEAHSLPKAIWGYGKLTYSHSTSLRSRPVAISHYTPSEQLRPAKTLTTQAYSGLLIVKAFVEAKCRRQKSEKCEKSACFSANRLPCGHFPGKNKNLATKVRHGRFV